VNWWSSILGAVLGLMLLFPIFGSIFHQPSRFFFGFYGLTTHPGGVHYSLFIVFEIFVSLVGANGLLALVFFYWTAPEPDFCDTIKWTKTGAKISDVDDVRLPQLRYCDLLLSGSITIFGRCRVDVVGSMAFERTADMFVSPAFVSMLHYHKPLGADCSKLQECIDFLQRQGSVNVGDSVGQVIADSARYFCESSECQRGVDLSAHQDGCTMEIEENFGARPYYRLM